MRMKAMVLGAAFCLVAATAGAAADPNVGTWRLNEAKSKIPAGAAKNLTVVYTAAGDSYKCVVDGVDGAGRPTHNEWTGKFDGNDYPIVGDRTADTRSIKMVKTGHYALTNKKGGKATTSGSIELSADGKTRTLTMETTDAAGKKLTSVAVYDRQ